MTHHNYHKVAGVIFLLIAIAHLLRALTVTPVAFGTIFIPMWFSWVVVIVAGYLSYRGLKNQ